MTCPNGHTSEAEDYCDVCGAPIAREGAGAEGAPGGSGASGAGELPPPLPDAAGDGDAGTAAAVAGGSGGAAGGGRGSGGASGAGGAGSAAGGGTGGASSDQVCPNCSTANSPEALFCENCGYDFTTGAMPRPPEPVSELDLGAPVKPGESPDVPAAAGGEVAAVPDGGAPDGDAPEGGAAGTAGGTAGGGSAGGGGTASWVAEVWVDPDWYAQQEADDPCPSPGLPVTVALSARSLLIGRRSVSRNIDPQIDVSSDIGVSRRHAQLTTDGQRWFIEDLQSSNGTFVGGARGPLPTQPVPPGQKRELDDDDRIYLGAWTRLVVRKLLPGEVVS